MKESACVWFPSLVKFALASGCAYVFGLYLLSLCTLGYFSPRSALFPFPSHLDLTYEAGGGSDVNSGGEVGTRKSDPRNTDHGVLIEDVAGGGGGRGRRGTDSEGNDGIQYRLPPTATKESIRALKDNGCLTPYVCEVGLCVRKCMHAFVRI